MENINIPMDSVKEKMTVAEALAIKSPIEAMLDRVIVIQCRDENEKKSLIVIPEYMMAGVYPNMLTKAVIKSVGKISSGRDSCVKEGDIVWMFPAGYESKINMNGVEFISYGERDIVAKIK